MFDFPAKPGDERMMKRFAELSGPLTPDAQQHDTAAYIDFLAGNECVSDGAMGVVGYCFTGKMGLYAAKVGPGRIAAAASFHGGRLVSDGPDSPHLLLPEIKARLYFGHATNDQSMLRKRSTASTGRWKPGAGAMRVRSTRVPVTPGPCPTVPYITSHKQNALSKN